MKIFKAIARDESGRKYGGTFPAESIEEARAMLRRQGYTDIRVELISDLSSSARDTDDEPPGWAPRALFKAVKQASLGLFRPYIMAVVVLIVIPAGVYWLGERGGPGINAKPEDPVLAYWNHEFSGRFDLQYELFGRTLRVLHGSPAAYVKFRTGKESIPTAGEAVLEAAPPRVLKKIELLEQGLKTAQVMATLRSEAVDETVLFELAVEKRAWRILAVRDAGRKSATAPSGAAGFKLQPSAQGESRTVEVAQDDPAKQTSAPRFTLEDARLAGQKDSVKKEIRQTLLQAFQSGRLTEAQYRERLKKLDDLSS